MARPQRKRRNTTGALTRRGDGPKWIEHLRRGIEDLIAGDLASAEKHLLYVLVRRARHPVALHHLGLLYLRRDEGERAVKAIERSIEVDPAQDGIWISLGEACEALGQHERAIEAYSSAVARDPSSADAHYVLGRALHTQGHQAEALEAFVRTIELAPDAPEAHDMLGQTLRLLERPADARRAFERAFQLQPESAHVRHRLGRALLEEARPGEGRPLLESAALALPEDARVQRDLGRARLLTEDLDGASKALHRALELDPDDAVAHTFLGWYHEYTGDRVLMERHYRRGSDLDPSITGSWYKMSRAGDILSVEELEQQLAAYNGKDSGRADYNFALGEVLTRAGAHGAAFARFREGNRQAGILHDRGTNSRRTRRAIEIADASFFRSRSGWGDPTQAPVFIVGMPRSGTSLVEQILSAHPSIVALGENSFVGDTVSNLYRSGAATARWPEALEHVDAEFAADLARRYWGTVGATRDDVCRFTDKAPGNFAMLGLIALMFPNARVIHVRRHPLDTIVSCFFTHFGGGRCAATYDLDDLTEFYLDYLALMEHWRSALPLALHEVEYEALTGDLESSARELVDFCGLEWDPACLAPHASDRVCFTASSHQVREQVHTRSIGRWKHYAEELAEVRAKIAYGVAPRAAAFRARAERNRSEWTDGT